MNVSIVIPVYNEEGYLPACLDAIAAQTVTPAEVIVVDNNCSDGTVEIARRYKFVRVIKEARQGTVFARDAGFQAAKSEVVVRFDADTRVPPDWIAQVVQAFRGNPHTAAVTGPPDFYDAAPAWFFNAGQVLAYQRLQKLLTGSYILWGANMAIRRDAWNAVSPLCAERLGVDEDIDLSFWLHKEGFPIRYMSDLRAGASLQRGRTGLRYTVRYLATWPRDYLLHRMYLRALLITAFIAVGVVISLPFLLISSLRSSPAD